MESTSTPDKILDAAERLFAEKGIAAVSLRRIIAAADVNIAAVHYHFGSKEELVRAVFRRRIVALNEKRLAALQLLRDRYGAESIPVRDILRAFLAPPLLFGIDDESGGRDFFRLVARAHAETDPVVNEELFLQLKDVIEIFLEELTRSLPDLPPHERSMRLAFSFGAMVQGILLPLKPQFRERMFPQGLSHDEMTDMLLSFCTGGMEANTGAKG